MPCAVFCLARLIVLCAVYCALRGLLCPARFIMLCAVYCAPRGILPCAVFCLARYSALRGLLCPARYSALHGLLCFARSVVPCAAYCALHGLLCFVRFIVPRAVYCAAMFIYVGVRRTTFMIDKTFCVRQGFSCAERSHSADFARAGARTCPCNADMWILSSVGNHGCGKGRTWHKKPPRSDLTPLRGGSDGNYGVGFSRRRLWTVYCFTLPLPQALPRFCVPRGRTYLPPPLTSRLCR